MAGRKMSNKVLEDVLGNVSPRCIRVYKTTKMHIQDRFTKMHGDAKVPDLDTRYPYVKALHNSLNSSANSYGVGRLNIDAASSLYPVAITYANEIVIRLLSKNAMPA
jgi:hypothetical protein